jgi:hypothetical protein
MTTVSHEPHFQSVTLQAASAMLAEGLAPEDLTGELYLRFAAPMRYLKRYRPVALKLREEGYTARLIRERCDSVIEPFAVVLDGVEGYRRSRMPRAAFEVIRGGRGETPA